MRRHIQRRLTLIEHHRGRHPRGFVRSLHIIRPDLDGAVQSEWFDLAEDRVLAEIGTTEPRLMVLVQADDERRVRVDSGGWRYLIGIGDGPEPAAAILKREQLRW